MNDPKTAPAFSRLRYAVISTVRPEEPNLSPIERAASALIGSALTLWALRRAPFALLLALLGGGLLVRAISGNCSLYRALGISTAPDDYVSVTGSVVPDEIDHLHHSDDPVEYSSEDSFPASDPPAFNA